MANIGQGIVEISQCGLIGLYEGLDENGKAAFQRAYNASYHPARSILHEIYDEVKSLNELRSVIAACHRQDCYPMGKIDGTRMWQVGQQVRAARNDHETPLNAFTAGVYCAVMMAQVDVLSDEGHSWSEIANESIIEATDSLTPYMHFKGVAYMIDNCSTTARLGARKWAPRFDYSLRQQVYGTIDAGVEPHGRFFDQFLAHPVHEVLKNCGLLRPSVSIALF